MRQMQFTPEKQKQLRDLIEFIFDPPMTLELDKAILEMAIGVIERHASAIADRHDGTTPHRLRCRISDALAVLNELEDEDDPDCDCREGCVTPPPSSYSSPIHINTIAPPPPLNEQAARIRALNQNEGAD
jgi:hypothetical protein